MSVAPAPSAQLHGRLHLGRGSCRERNKRRSLAADMRCCAAKKAAPRKPAVLSRQLVGPSCGQLLFAELSKASGWCCACTVTSRWASGRARAEQQVSSFTRAACHYLQIIICLRPGAVGKHLGGEARRAGGRRGRRAATGRSGRAGLCRQAAGGAPGEVRQSSLRTSVQLCSCYRSQVSWRACGARSACPLPPRQPIWAPRGGTNKGCIAAGTRSERITRAARTPRPPGAALRHPRARAMCAVHCCSARLTPQLARRRQGGRAHARRGGRNRSAAGSAARGRACRAAARAARHEPALAPPDGRQRARLRPAPAGAARVLCARRPAFMHIRHACPKSSGAAGRRLRGS